MSKEQLLELCARAKQRSADPVLQFRYGGALGRRRFGIRRVREDAALLGQLADALLTLVEKKR